MSSYYKTREFTDIREMIEQSVELYGDRNAFRLARGKEQVCITYNEYFKKINGLITSFLSDGYSDKTISICANNCYVYAILATCSVTTA